MYIVKEMTMESSSGCAPQQEKGVCKTIAEKAVSPMRKYQSRKEDSRESKPVKAKSTRCVRQFPVHLSLDSQQDSHSHQIDLKSSRLVHLDLRDCLDFLDSPACCCRPPGRERSDLSETGTANCGQKEGNCAVVVNLMQLLQGYPG